MMTGPSTTNSATHLSGDLEDVLQQLGYEPELACAIAMYHPTLRALPPPPPHSASAAAPAPPEQHQQQQHQQQQDEQQDEQQVGVTSRLSPPTPGARHQPQEQRRPTPATTFQHQPRASLPPAHPLYPPGSTCNPRYHNPLHHYPYQHNHNQPLRQDAAPPRQQQLQLQQSLHEQQISLLANSVVVLAQEIKHLRELLVQVNLNFTKLNIPFNLGLLSTCVSTPQPMPSYPTPLLANAFASQSTVSNVDFRPLHQQLYQQQKAQQYNQQSRPHSSLYSPNPLTQQQYQQQQNQYACQNYLRQQHVIRQQEQQLQQPQLKKSSWTSLISQPTSPLHDSNDQDFASPQSLLQKQQQQQEDRDETFAPVSSALPRTPSEQSITESVIASKKKAYMEAWFSALLSETGIMCTDYTSNQARAMKANEIYCYKTQRVQFNEIQVDIPLDGVVRKKACIYLPSNSNCNCAVDGIFIVDKKSMYQSFIFVLFKITTERLSNSKILDVANTVLAISRSQKHGCTTLTWVVPKKHAEYYHQKRNILKAEIAKLKHLNDMSSFIFLQDILTFDPEV